MLPSAFVSINDARRFGMVDEIEQTWRKNQEQSGILSPNTINNVIADWKADKFILIIPTISLDS